MHQLPPLEPPDPEVEGLALAELYQAEMRRMVAFREAPFDLFTEAEWLRENTLRRLWFYDARDDFTAHIVANGPVETGTGIYKLDGDGRLAFRRHVFDHVGAMSC